MTNNKSTQILELLRARHRLVIGYSPNKAIRVFQSGDEPLAEFRDEGTTTIRDLGGSLPVTVNGKECQGHVSFTGRDVIQIGPWTLDLSEKENLIPSPNSAGDTRGIAISLRDVRYEVTPSKFSFLPRKPLSLLRGIDLDILPGEFVGIIGASGSGKSTLIRVMNGDYTPIGTVAFNGQASDTFLKTLSHKMAYLPQELILHDSLTPRIALRYSAQLRSIPNSQKIVDSVLQQVGMVQQADVVIRNLSGGQKKRVALASELLNQPDALFLDEATSGLDPASEHEMMLLFRQLADSGITVVCITHFPGHLALCDRLLVVNRGVLIYNGSPANTLRHFNIRSLDEIYTVLQKRLTEEPLLKLPSLSLADTNIHSTESQGMVEEARNSGKQMPTLLRRDTKILLHDMKHIIFLLLQAPCELISVFVFRQFYWLWTIVLQWFLWQFERVGKHLQTCILCNFLTLKEICRRYLLQLLQIVIYSIRYSVNSVPL